MKKEEKSLITNFDDTSLVVERERNRSEIQESGIFAF